MHLELDVPQGPGFSDGDETWVIHKIVEIIIDLNLDSWYYVIRNRIGNPEVTKILFLVGDG